MDCPVCRTADIVCGKWTLLVIRDLAEEGVLERTTFPEVPPRVEYALTEKGRALVPIIESMREYGTEWLGASGSCSEASPPASGGDENQPALGRRSLAQPAVAALV
jgi:DNA-binding HxlR family transcriptional regulator